jgi:hypothetical protein
MSQAGVLNVASENPEIPITFDCNVGSATAIANVLNVLGQNGAITTGNLNTITIDVVSSGFTWNNVTSSTQLIAIENAYVTNNAGGVTYTLPATANFGDTFIITGKAGLWTLAQNANQQILLAASSTTIGAMGSLTSTSVGDSITCVCITGGASTVWRAYNSMGNMIVA